MLTNRLFSVNSILALRHLSFGTAFHGYFSVLPSRIHRHRKDHYFKRCENLIHNENALTGFPAACIVQGKWNGSRWFFGNQCFSGKTLRKLLNQRDLCDIQSFGLYTFELISGQLFFVTGLHLPTAKDDISAFQTQGQPALGMEMEMPLVASDLSTENLQIDSSPAEESNDSSVPGDLGFFFESGSDSAELAERDKITESGDVVLCKDVENGFNSKEMEGHNEVIEFSGVETEIVYDVVELSDEVTEVAGKVPDACGEETKTSESVLELDDKITDDNQSVSHGGVAVSTTSDPNAASRPDSKDGNNSQSTNCAEKLYQFRAKLASNQTVLPSELLLKVTELAARCHREGDTTCLTSEFLDQPPVEFAERLQLPEDDFHHEMEALFTSYFEEADGKMPTSKSKREKKKKSGEKTAADKPKRVEPSHFVAIQITNSEIHEKIADIQKSVLAKKRILEKALVKLPTLHLTLMVLHLEDNEQIERAKAALEASKKRVLEQDKDLAALPFAGIGDFNGKVVFVKVQEGPELDRLKEIAETVRQSFAELELFSTDSKGFAAHLTIMKLSRSPELFKRGIKKIDPAFYVEQKDDYLGLQPIASLQLCAMKKGENGYYPINHEVFFESEGSSK